MYMQQFAALLLSQIHVTFAPTMAAESSATKCPSCSSGKTVRVESNDWPEPMIFCGICGHMWPAAVAVQAKAKPARGGK